MARTDRLDAVIADAKDILQRRHPRLGHYAYDVLDGTRTLSGACLQGRAKSYSMSYYNARCYARQALALAGGEVVAVAHGRLVCAVAVGTDDYGRTIYETPDGPVVPHTSAQCRRVAR